MGIGSFLTAFSNGVDFRHAKRLVGDVISKLQNEHQDHLYVHDLEDTGGMCINFERSPEDPYYIYASLNAVKFPKTHIVMSIRSTMDNLTHLHMEEDTDKTTVLFQGQGESISLIFDHVRVNCTAQGEAFIEERLDRSFGHDEEELITSVLTCLFMQPIATLKEKIRNGSIDNETVLTTCPILSIPNDETCPICKEEKINTPRLTWARAGGCDRHRFHTACIQPWTGMSCPVCRAPLESRAGSDTD